MSGFLSQILAAAWRPFQWWVTIAPWERGLRVRLGKVAATLEPGIHFRVPFLDRVYVQSVRLRIIEQEGQTITTADGKVLTVSIAVQFAIEDIAKLYATIAMPEMTLLSRAAALIAEHVARARSTELTGALLEERVSAALPGAEWGLGQCRAYITTFAVVRTYRLLQNSYRSLSGVDEMERGEYTKATR